MDVISIGSISEAVSHFKEEWDSGSDSITAMTSGSTGKPKEIHLLKSDMIASAKATNKFFGLTSDSLLYCPLSIDYIAAKMMLVRASLADCTVIFDTPSLCPLSSFPELSIDLVAIVPSQIDGFLKNVHKQTRVKNVVVGGSAIRSEAENKLINSGIDAWATYGMTETCSHIALRHIGIDDGYKPMPGISVDLDDRGCLVIFSSSLSQRVFKTNDLAQILENGDFKILGRYDNVIISGGKKIFPEELENLLRPQMGNLRFYITSRPSSLWGQEVVMMVEKNSLMSSNDILSLCRRVFHPHHVPKEIIEVEKIEVTDRGKILRKHVE